ncbi:hypothetical protein [Nocardia gipuzkoensis]
MGSCAATVARTSGGLCPRRFAPAPPAQSSSVRPSRMVKVEPRACLMSKSSPNASSKPAAGGLTYRANASKVELCARQSTGLFHTAYARRVITEHPNGT